MAFDTENRFYYYKDSREFKSVENFEIENKRITRNELQPIQRTPDAAKSGSGI